MIRQTLRATAALVFLSAGTSPVLGQAVLEEGRTALLAGEYDEAIGTLSRLTKREPESAVAARLLVQAYREVGRYADAARAARAFMDANPDSPELWNALGEVSLETGDRDTAVRAFTRARQAGASDSLRARLNVALLAYDAGEREEAMRTFDTFIDVYNRSTQLDSRTLTAVATAVRYLGVNDPQLYKDALRAYDEAIARDADNLEPQVLVGELFLEKYVGDEAKAAFDKVLARNPEHARALLGLARASRFVGRPEAMEQARKSLEVNPSFVSARTFLASLYIELEDFDEAAREIARALEVNPASLEALAVQAAVHYLAGDADAFENVERRVLELNPRHAGFYTTLADVAAKNRRYHEAVGFARRAVELDPKSWRGFAFLGMNQLRTGAVAEGRANLDTSFAGDPYDVWTKNTLDLLDTLVRYPRTTSDRFQFHIDGKESALLTLYLAPLAEEAYDRLAAKYGYRPPTPVRVEVFPHHADFSVRTVGLVGLGALGVSFGPVIAMDSPSARRLGEFNWGSTFWHELAHTFHLGMTEGRVPRWFTEGLAVYEERQARPGWGADVVPSFLDAFRSKRLVPVQEMNRGFMRPEFPEQLGFSYYQASLVCELIVRDYGSGALVELLGAFKRGLSSAQAFRAVLDADIEAFDRSFRDYVEQRFAVQLASLRTLGDWATLERSEAERRVRRDPEDFVAQLAMGKARFDAGETDRAVPHLERAKELFPEYAGSDSPYWYLAQIHKTNGDTRRAADELAALTEINEQHYQAHTELADLLLMVDDSAGGAAALERAMFISPYEFPVHARLAAVYGALGRHDGAIRERRAVLALDPVDRADALYQLAKAYFGAGDIGAARKTVLESLELAPNFEEALDLLLRIHAARGSDTDGSR